jgi:tRNA pseudouridine38-40 synthase
VIVNQQAKHNYKIVLKYDGTNFRGWQVQPGERTVQQTVEEALWRVFGERFRVYASGRTDTGVHALGQVINFSTAKGILPDRLLKGLNELLPEDVMALDIREVHADFHARYSAVSKTYRYTILRKKPPRFGRRTDVYYWGGPLDVEKMRRSALFLIGTHDFASFGNNPRHPVKERVRTIEKLDIEEEGDYIHIAIKGSGFLYKMARSIVGTLIWVGTGKIPPDQMESIIEARDRTKAGPVAAASGLCLVEVEYPG